MVVRNCVSLLGAVYLPVERKTRGKPGFKLKNDFLRPN